MEQDDSIPYFEDLQFPTAGIDVSTAAIDQRPKTTPFAVNVRGFDTGGRLRGGTRPGLTPFFGAGSTEQLNGFNPIQSLSCIVTCSQAATFNSSFIIVKNDVHYSESNNPPVRDSPTTSNQITWYEDTKPNNTFVTQAIVGTPDGGGTGKGTATFKISYDGTTVSLLCTFVSAGFAGPYFFSGRPQSFTMTQPGTIFFNPSVSGMSSNWTVISGPFIGNYFFNCYYPAP